MITLEYYNGNEWVFVDEYYSENIAWISLGNDNLNYRTVDDEGNVLTDKSIKP